MMGTPAALPRVPGQLPLIGHALPLLRDPLAFLRAAASHGPAVRVRLGVLAAVVLNDPDLIRELMVDQADSFEKGVIFEKARPALGNGVFMSEGPLHRDQRRLIQPAFSKSIVDSYVDIIRERTATALAVLRDGARLDLAELTNGLALDVLLASFFPLLHPTGDEVATLGRVLAQIIRPIMIRTLYPYPWIEKVPIGPHRRFDRAVRQLRAFIERLIDGYPVARAGPHDLVAILVSDPRGRRSQIVDEIASVLLAGVTPGSILAWSLYETASKPAIDQALHHEVAAVAVRAQTLGRLVYAERVLNEATRLHTPNWVLMRRSRRLVRLGRWEFPAGTEFLFSLTLLHRDPRLFPDPDRFQPQRWTAELFDRLPRGSYIPFGGGPHKCVGADFAWTQMLTGLATIIADWRFTVPADSSPSMIALHPLLGIRELPVLAHRR